MEHESSEAFIWRSAMDALAVATTQALVETLAALAEELKVHHLDGMTVEAHFFAARSAYMERHLAEIADDSQRLASAIKVMWDAREPEPEVPA